MRGTGFSRFAHSVFDQPDDGVDGARLAWRHDFADDWNLYILDCIRACHRLGLHQFPSLIPECPQVPATDHTIRGCRQNRDAGHASDGRQLNTPLRPLSAQCLVSAQSVAFEVA